MTATEVTAGLAESNGSLLPGLWHDSLHVTCGLTACTPGSGPGPTLGNEYGKTLPYSSQILATPLTGLSHVESTHCLSAVLLIIYTWISEADLGMFSMFGRTAAPTKRGPQKGQYFSFFATWQQARNIEIIIKE